MKLDIKGNYTPWLQPAYGYDANSELVVAPTGYIVVSEGERIQDSDIPFDVYAGWIKEGDSYHSKNKYHAYSRGRWTCWARPKRLTSTP